MSWWSKSPLIEAQIDNATSEDIPSGEQDLALNLEICDAVRSKQVPVNETLRILKRRLYHRNPNVQILTLHLLDLLFKNGGHHLLVEFCARDFVDSYAAQLMALRNQSRSPEVEGLMLEYLQTWALAAQDQAGLGYLYDKYMTLKTKQGIEFPVTAPTINASFLDAATAPEWVDSDTCMKSGQPFTFYNRKHHCRNCGGVFLQEYCSNFMPLPHFGINTPERVCDDCKAKLEAKNRMRKPELTNSSPTGTSSFSGARSLSNNNQDLTSRYDRELKEAIELSLKASQAPPQLPQAPKTNNDDDEMDEDMRRAIEASLADMNISHGQRPSQQSYSQQQQPRPSHASQVSSESYPAPLGVQSTPRQPVQEDIVAKYKTQVEQFAAAVATAQPRDSVYDQKLVGLNRLAMELQPQIIGELKTVANRLQTLEDVNGRLGAVSSYYDQILEQELNPDAFVAPLPASENAAQPYPPGVNAPTTLGNTPNGHTSGHPSLETSHSTDIPVDSGHVNSQQPYPEQPEQKAPDEVLIEL